MAAFISGLKLVLTVERKASRHAPLVRDFARIERQLVGDACSEAVKCATLERLEIEATEPPILRVLDVVGHNELLQPRGMTIRASASRSLGFDGQRPISWTGASIPSHSAGRGQLGFFVGRRKSMAASSANLRAVELKCEHVASDQASALGPWVPSPSGLSACSGRNPSPSLECSGLDQGSKYAMARL